MNVLLVDDQKAIVDSLRNGIRWDLLPVEQVYTACSAKEAKLVLMNFAVDVLVTDIEMPEENGISLCKWTKENFKDVECIFLTSHADFEYAKEAIKLGNVDYILQPVRYDDVEKVLERTWERIREKKQIQKLMGNQKMVMEQKDIILEALLSKAVRGKDEDANQIFSHYKELFRTEYDNCFVYPMVVQLIHWKRITNVWNDKLVWMALSNVLEETFAEEHCKVGLTSEEDGKLWIFLMLEKNILSEPILKEKLKIFCEFINQYMDFTIALYPADGFKEISFYEFYKKLSKRVEQNKDKREGVFWEDIQKESEVSEDPIETALQYIRKNPSKNISRTDVAEYVHLNEEYFSRLFKQRTGDTFKNVILMEKMEEAKKLLTHSRLSVSIIASKVGYDNFSHFSKMFKKVTNQTPQEYRKEHQK